jgi:ribonucleases P/MRP protein subunit RPP40
MYHKSARINRRSNRCARRRSTRYSGPFRFRQGYGVTGRLLAWLTAYLSDRKQRVVIGNAHSDWKNVDSGVPQGSVLGPLLFLIFINDMPEVVHHLLKLFADDSKIIAIIKNDLDIELLQQDIDKLIEWSVEWRMRFNYEKCKIMRIKNKSSPTDLHLPFVMRDLSTSTVHYMLETGSERDLGIQIKHNLKWDDHVDIAASKANRTLGMLRKTFKCWDVKMVKILYTTYVRPHLEYASAAWFPNEAGKKRLESVQSRATMLVHQLRQLSYDERLLQLGLTTLAERRKRGDAIQLFKTITGSNTINWLYPIQLNPILSQEGPAGNLRRENPFIKQRTSTIQRESFFTNRTIDTWNGLSDHVRSATTTNGFKKRYDDFMSSKPK